MNRIIQFFFLAAFFAFVMACPRQKPNNLEGQTDTGAPGNTKKDPKPQSNETNESNTPDNGSTGIDEKNEEQGDTQAQSVREAARNFLRQEISKARYHGSDEPSNDEIYSLGVRFSPFGGRNAPDLPVISRYSTTTNGAFLALKFPNEFFARLPQAVRDAFAELGVDDFEIFFLVQDAPGAEEAGIAFDPNDNEAIPAVKGHVLVYSWEHPDTNLAANNVNYRADIHSGIFDTRNDFMASYAPQVQRPLQQDRIHIHPRDDGGTIFSGPTGQIENAQWNQNYAFWSIVSSEAHGKAAITLHWLIVRTEFGGLRLADSDITFTNEDIKNYLNQSCLGVNTCTVGDFVSYLTTTYSEGGDEEQRKTRALIETFTDFVAVNPENRENE